MIFRLILLVSTQVRKSSIVLSESEMRNGFFHIEGKEKAYRLTKNAGSVTICGPTRTSVTVQI